MLKLSLIFCIVFCSSFLQAQNKKDAHGKRTGKWVYTGADKPSSGISKTGKVEEGIYVDGRKEGVWTKYHKDGKTPKLKGNYSNNRPLLKWSVLPFGRVLFLMLVFNIKIICKLRKANSKNCLI